MVFIALVIPILCLIDILKNNQTFRNEELAIRRAFGAPQKKIIFLLLFDNLFITILAGVLGLVFSFLFFAVLSNESLSNLFLVFFNWRAFFYYTAIFLIIGAIAGIVPALNLSKHQIVNALYATNND
jgi:putative ABC transport system permease protein